MKVLLINPPEGKVYGKFKSPDHPPLGLAYLGAVLLKSGHSVKIIDIDADGISLSNLKEIIANYSLIGLTATTPTFGQASKIFEVVKENSRAITVLGGIHATIYPEECIKNENIDFLVRGEGEETFLELLDSLEKKKEISSIKGISFKKNKKIIHNPNRDLIKNLDDLPFPARELFKHSNYSYPDSFLSPVMPIMTSRGCPHACTYCCTKYIFSRKVRFRSSKNVMEEIEHLIKKYKVKEIHIWDDNFTLNKQRVKQIHDEILSKAIKIKFAFPNGLRADQVDEDILRWLKEMGTYSVCFGVESGNQIILDNVEKGTNLAQIEKAYELSKKIGLETWGFFMFGLPGETSETIKNTINFAKKIDPDVAKFHILKPFPGTKIFDQLKKQNLITNYNFDDYGIHTKPVHRLPNISEEDLINASKKAYREFYLRPLKIFKHALRIKSFNRFKVNVRTAFDLLKTIK